MRKSNFLKEVVLLPFRPYCFFFSKKCLSTQGIQTFLKSYVFIMLSLGSIATILLAYSFMENMKQSDENTMYYGLVTSMVFLFWIAIVFAPYRAGQALKNVENRFLHELGWQWQEKVLAVYFKILALSLTILLINIAVLILFLALSFFGIVYSVVVLIGALILIIGTLGFILLSDNFAPFQHLEKIWSFIELPTRFFEFEKTILTSLHIEPVWLIPIGFVLFLIIPNLIAVVVLWQKEKLVSKN